MKKKYVYNTLPKREVFVEHLLEDISTQQKDAVELLIDCNDWYEKKDGKPLLSKKQLQLVTVFLHFRYTNLQNFVEAEIDEYNNTINENEGRNRKDNYWNFN